MDLNRRMYREKVPADVREKFAKKFMRKNKVLVTYLRDKDKRPYGVVVAFKQGNEIRLGHSMWNAKLDRWNKYLGIDWAIQRALAGGIESVRHSHEIDKAYARMSDRALKYFGEGIFREYPHLPRKVFVNQQNSLLPPYNEIMESNHGPNWDKNIDKIFGGHRLEKVCRDV